MYCWLKNMQEHKEFDLNEDMVLVKVYFDRKQTN